MVVGGNLSKADFTKELAKALSSNQKKPLTEAFYKLAEKKVKLGAYDEYKKTIKKPKKAKAKKVEE